MAYHSVGSYVPFASLGLNTPPDLFHWKCFRTPGIPQMECLFLPVELAGKRWKGSDPPFLDRPRKVHRKGIFWGGPQDFWFSVELPQ
jgi:hypothetical protein